MVEQSGSDWGFRKLADLFQQMSAGFELRTLQDLATWGSRSGLEAFIDAVRTRLIGRRIDARIGGQDISLTLSALDARLDPIGATAGQAEEVTVTGTGVVYAGISVQTVTAVLGNLHTRIGSRPTLVAAPIDLRLAVSWEDAVAVAHRYVPRLDVSFGGSADGPVRLTWRRHGKWVWLATQVAVEAGRVTVRPTSFGLGRWKRRLRGRWPACALPLALPANVRVVGIEVGVGGVDIQLRVDEWRMDYQQVLRVTPRTA